MRFWAIPVVGLCVVLAGCDQLHPPQKQAQAPAPPPISVSVPTAPASEIGRYIIIHSPQVERDTVLLDTKTGQTWQLVELQDLTDSPVAWQPMVRLDTSADYEMMRALHPPKGSKPAH
jgi:hypothetical protein